MMFRVMKLSGFNFEDIYLYDLERIFKLIVLVVIVFIWVYKVGIDKDLNIKEIKRKKYGRKVYSFFKYGFIELIIVFVNNCSLVRNKKFINILLCIWIMCK